MSHFLEEQPQPTPEKEVANKFKVVSAQWGAKDIWLDVTEKICAKCKEPKARIGFSNNDAGGDVCPGVKKSLVVRFLYGGEERTAILAEGETAPLVIGEPEEPPKDVHETPAVRSDAEKDVPLPCGGIDVSALLPILRRQNPEMYEEFFVRNCMEILPKHVSGKRVLDIGANLGMFSIFCRSLGSKEVLAVEPEPANFKALFYNVSGYGITPLNCAATDSRTVAVRMWDKDSLAKAIPDTKGAILAMSLGQLLAWFPENDDDVVLKIDTEGSEYDILLDARGADIRRFSVIFMEVHPVPHLEARPARTPKYIEEYLCCLGFKMEARRHLFNWKFDEKGNATEYEKIKDVESWTLRRK
jgi:FkbM family methyltransferase